MMTVSRCEYCVMDNSASEFFVIPDQGCNFCVEARKRKEVIDAQNNLVSKMRYLKKGKKSSRFDAILGMSGGLDSSYLLHEVAKYDLRILVVHIDTGWNSAMAVQNIHNMVNRLNVEFRTVVLNWESIRKVQNVMLRSGVMNQDALQDHLFAASLIREARNEKVRVILSGLNFAGESIGPQSWGHRAIDKRWLDSIMDREQMAWPKNLPRWSVLRNAYNHYVSKEFRVISILDDLHFSPTSAMKILSHNYKYLDYGGKHNESVFTKFFQKIYLPERYHIDKRKSHLSSLIVAGEKSRESALRELNKAPIDNLERRYLVSLVSDKLQISKNEIERIINMPISDSEEYFKTEEYVDRTLLKLSQVRKKFHTRNKTGLRK